jgi:hypothetical protein
MGEMPALQCCFLELENDKHYAVLVCFEVSVAARSENLIEGEGLDCYLHVLGDFFGVVYRDCRRHGSLRKDRENKLLLI